MVCCCYSHGARKSTHAGLQALAIILIALGLVAVIQSHNLKRPTSIRNLYSPHSFLGVFTVVLLGLQVSIGWPGLRWICMRVCMRVFLCEPIPLSLHRARAWQHFPILHGL